MSETALLYFHSAMLQASAAVIAIMATLLAVSTSIRTQQRNKTQEEIKESLIHSKHSINARIQGKLGEIVRKELGSDDTIRYVEFNKIVEFYKRNSNLVNELRKFFAERTKDDEYGREYLDMFNKIDIHINTKMIKYNTLYVSVASMLITIISDIIYMTNDANVDVIGIVVLNSISIMGLLVGIVFALFMMRAIISES